MSGDPRSDSLLALEATRTIALHFLRAVAIIIRKAHLPDGPKFCVQALELMGDCARTYLLNRDIYDPALLLFANNSVELGGVTATSATHWAIQYALHLVSLFADHGKVALIRAGGLPEKDRNKLEKAWPNLRMLVQHWGRRAKGSIGLAELLEIHEGTEVYTAVQPPNLRDLRRLQTQVEVEYARVLNQVRLDAHEGTKRARRQKGKRRRRASESKPIPLTQKQAEAVQLVGEHKGNITAAAIAAGNRAHRAGTKKIAATK